MKNVLLLLKKDFRIRGIGKDSGKVFSAICGVLLIAIVYGAFAFVFCRFTKGYLNAVFGESEIEGPKRAYELLTVVYAAVILLNVILGARKIYSTTVDTKDVEVLMCQPISSGEIFAYKLIKIYGSQVVSCILILLPAQIIIDVYSEFAGGFNYWLFGIINLFTAPLLSCAIASLISVPFLKVMRFVERKFIIHLLLYVVVIAVGFWIYGLFLRVLSDLLNTGDINYVFERKNVNMITAFAEKSYPINFLSSVCFGKNVLLSLLGLTGTCLVSGAITFFVIRAVFNGVLQRKMEGDMKAFGKKRKTAKMHSPINSLILKEFLVILRTPSYAFSYFATTFTLPLMVYVCVDLMKKMTEKLTVIDCNFGLSVFVIATFMVLTNTFCTTNISRDGNMTGIFKTLPVKAETIIYAKIIFCMAVSLISVLASVIVLLCTGDITLLEGLFVFLSAGLLSFAEVAFATKKDLKSPDDLSSTENVVQGKNVSELAVIGIIAALIMGVGALLISAVSGLYLSKTVSTLLSSSFCLLVSLVLFFASYCYLKKGLKEAYYSSGCKL